MNYKETLFFVAKCLTINHEAHNKRIVEEMLQSNTVDWNEVVKLSTAHFVFPALYCNLKRASFLSYLPEDLVDYMKYITKLNRERNEEIIIQAKELNTLLLAHNITPIFIKGTGNLLEGLYEDIGERMVSDIDFIFSKEEYMKTIKVLDNNGYFTFQKTDNLFPGNKHYPRLINHDKIAGVEIHDKFITHGKYDNEFNYRYVKDDLRIINKICVISYENQLSLSIVASQINDFGFEQKSLALRNAYDVFLLSKKTIAKNTFKKFERLEHPLNCFLASCYEVFNKPLSLQYISSKKTDKYLFLFFKYINDRKLATQKIKQVIRKKTNRKARILVRFKRIYKSLFKKEYRIYITKKIFEKKLAQRKTDSIRD